MEQWKVSPLTPNFIEISNYGNVRTKIRFTPYVKKDGKTGIQKRPKKTMSPYVSQNGYFIIAVQQGKFRVKHLMHRLVASCFCKNYNPDISVNHIDGNKLNNHFSNLEWVTLAENTKHQWRTGLVDLRGEKHPNCKIKDCDLDSIRNANLDFFSIKYLAKKYNVSDSLIWKIRAGQKRKIIKPF